MGIKRARLGSSDHLAGKEEQRQLTLACPLCKNDIINKICLIQLVLIAWRDVPNMAVPMKGDRDDRLHHECCICKELDFIHQSWIPRWRKQRKHGA